MAHRRKQNRVLLRHRRVVERNRRSTRIAFPSEPDRRALTSRASAETRGEPQTCPRPKRRNRLPRSSSRSWTTYSTRATKALAIIETYDQARVDRLCQAVAWAVANKQTFTRLVDDGHRGERSRRRREPDGQADEDPRRPARRAAPEERRHHRGAAREGHREIRQAGGNHRLHRSHHQSRPHARRQRDLRRSRRATWSSSRRIRARRRRRSRPCG